MSITGSYGSSGSSVSLQGPNPGVVGVTLPYIGGLYYPAPSMYSNSLLLVNNTGYYVPYTPLSVHTFSGMYTVVSTIGTAGAVGHFAVYADNGNAAPGLLLTDLGTVVTTATGIAAVTGQALALSSGALYWLAIAAQGTPTTQATVTAGDNRFIIPPYPALSTAVPGRMLVTYTGTVAAGFVSNPTVAASAGNQPLIGLVA